MGKVIQNGIILIGFLLIAAVGYYLYLQNDSILLGNTEIDPTLELRAANFIARQQELQQLVVSRELFSDPRFTSLRSFSTPVPTAAQGRNNPFLPIGRNVSRIELPPVTEPAEETE